MCEKINPRHFGGQICLIFETNQFQIGKNKDIVTVDILGSILSGKKKIYQYFL